MTDQPPTDQPDPAAVERAYDRWAASYDGDGNVTRDLAAEVLRAAPLALAGGAVLELGCGTGRNTVWLAERAQAVVALEFSMAMLAQARSHLARRHVRFVRHDVRSRWPLPRHAVDLVVGSLVLEHVEHLGPVFREAARVLKPGGSVWFCELHPERQRRGGQAHFTDAVSGATVYVPAHRHTVSDYVNAGIAAGLTLHHLGEHWEPDAPADAAPRLLSVLFAR